MYYIIKKNSIEEVLILNKSNNKTLISCRGEEDLIDNNNIYYSRNEARIAQDEKRIIRNFKNNKTNKSGYGYCSYCNKKIHKDNCTVDHIKSLHSFGGRRDIRENRDIWKQAWDIDNLTLACQECNFEKDNLHPNVFQHKLSALDKKAKILNMNKLKKSAEECFGNQNNRKVGYGISTSSNEHNYFSALYMAKADSNILDKSLILY